jgi:hypothetical protein
MQTKTIYSAYSGTFYEIPESDIKLLEMGQIPLLKKPNNCKNCFNRGHIGRDNQTYQYQICNCIRKVLDIEEIKNSLVGKINLKDLD